MVYLFLSEPNWIDEVDSESTKMRISLLNQLESVLWSLMMSGGRSEARLWLCNTIAEMSSITPHHQRELFVKLLRSMRQKQGLASQLLLLMFEKSPQKGGFILVKRSYVLEKFFEGNPRRISQWFSSFSSGSGLEHGKGAKALSQFAFINRDICWEELEWKGKHGQSPAMVATKPHYFLDLDIQRTVENFLENVPEFWSSNEFAESIRDGEILFIDRQFFVQYFVDLMYKEDSKDMWEVINEFIMEQPFSSLSRHLLITLEELDLCYFLELLCKLLKPKKESTSFDRGSHLFEIILSECSGCGSIDQILLLNAIITQGRQLLRLSRDEEAKEEQAKINDILSKISAIPSSINSLTPFFKNCFKMKNVEVIKYLGLQCWLLYYRLSQECQTPQSWESLFVENEIHYRKSDKYALLDLDRSSDESIFYFDYRESAVVKHRKRQKGKSKRRKKEHDDIYDDELLDFDAKNHGLDVQSTTGSCWLLSTDGYSTSWTSADLPEHLYKHCLLKWMTCFFAKRVEGCFKESATNDEK
ncbi:Glycine--tRNA ligase beta subunit [Quillaja saponaria]|uniref:Glycine--tRNA ligase beta subunit n=1 Tax=Quillaja saponaria TaxID=32244 RepID=A0AAD7PFP6_QUISA|nr:Glycine--tRNA ligase beta subunit [Quillaja saponaria]